MKLFIVLIWVLHICVHIEWSGVSKKQQWKRQTLTSTHTHTHAHTHIHLHSGHKCSIHTLSHLRMFWRFYYRLGGKSPQEVWSECWGYLCPLKPPLWTFLQYFRSPVQVWKQLYKKMHTEQQMTVDKKMFLRHFLIWDCCIISHDLFKEVMPYI